VLGRRWRAAYGLSWRKSAGGSCSAISAWHGMAAGVMVAGSAGDMAELAIITMAGLCGARTRRLATSALKSLGLPHRTASRHSARDVNIGVRRRTSARICAYVSHTHTRHCTRMRLALPRSRTNGTRAALRFHARITRRLASAAPPACATHAALAAHIRCALLLRLSLCSTAFLCTSCVIF